MVSAGPIETSAASRARGDLFCLAPKGHPTGTGTQRERPVPSHSVPNVRTSSPPAGDHTCRVPRTSRCGVGATTRRPVGNGTTTRPAGTSPTSTVSTTGGTSVGAVPHVRGPRKRLLAVLLGLELQRLSRRRHPLDLPSEPDPGQQRSAVLPWRSVSTGRNGTYAIQRASSARARVRCGVRVPTTGAAGSRPPRPITLAGEIAHRHRTRDP